MLDWSAAHPGYRCRERCKRKSHWWLPSGQDGVVSAGCVVALLVPAGRWSCGGAHTGW
jgi:hypothetical protein